jgi:glycosyltransferase involved in cell wall biosynthesis
MGSPLISIVTVVYNDVINIERTIESVIEQDFSAKEYIVIDGKSTDGTQIVLNNYVDDVDKIIIERDDGIADAFNKGVRASKGEYIIFLNAGDCFMNSKILSHVSNQIKLHNRPTILYGDCCIYDENQLFLKKISVNYDNLNVYKGDILPHPAVFSKRDYFDTYGNFDTSYKLAMDFDWMLRGIFTEKVIHISTNISKVLAGGVSTQNYKLAVSEIIKALKKNNFIKNPLSEFYVSRYFVLRHYVGNFLRAFKNLKKKYTNYLVKKR